MRNLGDTIVKCAWCAMLLVFIYFAFETWKYLPKPKIEESVPALSRPDLVKKLNLPLSVATNFSIYVDVDRDNLTLINQSEYDLLLRKALAGKGPFWRVNDIEVNKDHSVTFRTEFLFKRKYQDETFYKTNGVWLRDEGEYYYMEYFDRN